MDYEWQFKEAQPGGWDWVCLDRATRIVIKVSDRTFEQLYDCVEDAKQHGYVPQPLPLPSSGKDPPKK